MNLSAKQTPAAYTQSVTFDCFNWKNTRAFLFTSTEAKTRVRNEIHEHDFTFHLSNSSWLWTLGVKTISLSSPFINLETMKTLYKENSEMSLSKSVNNYQSLSSYNANKSLKKSIFFKSDS